MFGYAIIPHRSLVEVSAGRGDRAVVTETHQ